MIRTTHVSPETDNTTDYHFQEKLDAFWNLIENHYEEEWRIDYKGALNLIVDSDMLERVLMDNYAVAYYTFGAYAGGQTKEGKKFLLRRPEYLIGEYIITGVYDDSQRLVNGERTYIFTQGA